MGAGKSTIGRQLANRLGIEFVDVDHVIEEHAGADISWIFDVEGEAGFRDREQSALEELLSAEGACVIATGGGIVIRERNRELLSALKPVIYLSADVEQLVERTSKDKKRPLLQVADPRTRIVELLDQRDPLYRSVASHIVSTNGLHPRNVVQRILKQIQP